MKTDVQAAVEELMESEHEMISPPKELSGKRLKNWYHHNCAMTPVNWYEHPAVPANKKKIQSLQGLPKPAATGPVVTTTHVPTPETGPKNVDDAIPVIPPADIEKVKKAGLMTLDVKSRKGTVDPKQIQALETRHVPYSTSYKLAAGYIDSMTYEWFMDVGKVSLATLANIAFSERNERLTLEHDLDMQTSTTGTPVVETKPAVAAAAAAPAQPQRRAGLLRR
jgi:hypothetical protein